MHRPCSIPLSPDCPDPSRLSSGIRYPPALLLRSALRTAILGLSVSDTPPPAPTGADTGCKVGSDLSYCRLATVPTKVNHLMPW